MSDSSTQSITIAAAPDAIMAAIADFDSYPQWVDAITSVEITEPGAADRASRVRFAMDAGLIKDTYELAYTWSPDGLAVTWELVASTLQKAQHGSYLLRALPDGTTEVTYTLAVQLAIPMVAMLRRKAERTIMETALSELRTHVERHR